MPFFVAETLKSVNNFFRILLHKELYEGKGKQVSYLQIYNEE
jgi:hypothetical protein